MECARACSQTAGTTSPRRHKRITTRARAHAARRPARPRAASLALICAGQRDDITHLQDQVVVDSKIFNARLHVV
jgi:hypothetical protein